jgi:hypothetical protein
MQLIVAVGNVDPDLPVPGRICLSAKNKCAGIKNPGKKER